jgi:radical SAM superfamily enzyme YgiQ (UPF0313 family)
MLDILAAEAPNDDGLIDPSFGPDVDDASQTATVNATPADPELALRASLRCASRPSRRRRRQILLINIGRQTVTVPAITPPIGLLYLAAFVRDRCRVDVHIIDQRAENCSCDSIISRAISLPSDIIGLRCLTSDAHLLKELVCGLRRALPQVKILVGGPHVSAVGAQVLREVPVDAAVVGRGEVSFRMIVDAIVEGSDDFRHIPGLIWRSAAGEIVANPGQALPVDDLDSLPFPAYDLLDLPLYWRARNMGMIPHRKYLALFTSRGCPFQCSYCHSIFGKRFRANSAEYVADEMQHYIRTFGVNDFSVVDDVFNLDPSRVLALSDLIHKRGMKVKMSFPNGLRTDILTPEIVDALAGLGTHSAAFALETGSPRLQKLIGKNLDIPKYLEGVRMAAQRGIFSYGFVMMGFPTETEEELQTTIDVTCQSKLHGAVFFAVTPFPMTKLCEEAWRTHPEKLARLDYRGTDYVHNMAVNLSNVPDPVLVSHLRKAYRRFYGNPARLARILRDFPKPTQLPIMLRSVLRLSRKSSLRETEVVLST